MGVLNKPEKNRNVYHYKLRELKKLRQSKIKLSVSKSMMTSKNRNYWKSARAVRKIVIQDTRYKILYFRHEAHS